MAIPRIYIYCEITVTCEYHISNNWGRPSRFLILFYHLRFLWLVWTLPRRLQAIRACQGTGWEESKQQEEGQGQHCSDSGHSVRIRWKCKCSLYISISHPS